LKDDQAFDGQTGEGRNIYFGVREHAMAGITSGMAYYGGIRPFASTFLVFSDYMRPSIRLAAMSSLPVIYIFSHDSVALGEDGPTHQPVEQLMSLRNIPSLVVIRPCDTNETAEAWRWLMQYTKGPVALVLTRQKVPTLDRTKFAPASGLYQGAYVLSDTVKVKPQAIIIATGSEVDYALAAQELLVEGGIPTRVVSMPCWEIFEAQPEEYRESVLPSAIKARVSVETGVTLGWERWVGNTGITIGIDRFGASAPGNVDMEKFGFTPENIAKTVQSLL
jgi:transketolase